MFPVDKSTVVCPECKIRTHSNTIEVSSETERRYAIHVKIRIINLEYNKTLK